MGPISIGILVVLGIAFIHAKFDIDVEPSPEDKKMNKEIDKVNKEIEILDTVLGFIKKKK